MKKLIILKLGGSVITVKDNPFTPNYSNLERLANEIQNGVQKQNQLVIIHGAGSFGHIIVQKSGIDKGIKHPKQLNDFAVTQRIQNEWNAIVTKQLQDVNLPAIPCQVSSHVILKQGRIDTINLTAIEGMIKIGLIPVLYGVPAYDIVDGCRILSGDQIASYIAKELQAEKIIHGTNVDEVANCIGIDPRIGRSFLNAGPGFGGSCLPKDLETMIQFSSKIGANPLLLKAVQQTNDLQIKQIIHLLEKNLGNIRNKRITVLGLSFKENSSDIRGSRSIELIKILLKKKSKITVHDPKAMKNTESIFKNKITYANSLLESLDDCQCTIIMTPWKIYTKLKNSNFKNMKRKLIIDARRILSRKNLNVEYFALGLGAN